MYNRGNLLPTACFLILFSWANANGATEDLEDVNENCPAWVGRLLPKFERLCTIDSCINHSIDNWLMVAPVVTSVAHVVAAHCTLIHSTRTGSHNSIIYIQFSMDRLAIILVMASHVNWRNGHSLQLELKVLFDGSNVEVLHILCKNYDKSKKIRSSLRPPIFEVIYSKPL